jgi:hypothetical protein
MKDAEEEGMKEQFEKKWRMKGTRGQGRQVDGKKR